MNTGLFQDFDQNRFLVCNKQNLSQIWFLTVKQALIRLPVYWLYLYLGDICFLAILSCLLSFYNVPVLFGNIVIRTLSSINVYQLLPTDQNITETVATVYVHLRSWNYWLYKCRVILHILRHAIPTLHKLTFWAHTQCLYSACTSFIITFFITFATVSLLFLVKF